MQTFIIGDSHIWQPQHALKEIPEFQDCGVSSHFLGAAGTFREPFHKVDGEEIALVTKDLTARIKSFYGKPKIKADDTLWVLCMGMHTAGWLRHQFWQVAAPASASLAGPRVSEGALHASFQGMGAPVLQFMADLTGAGIPCVVMSAPPPRRDNPAFTDETRVRMKMSLDRGFRDFFVDAAAQIGVTCLTPPQETYDEDGFLVRHFLHPRAEDVHHANRDYGRLQVAQILQYRDQLTGTAAH